MITDSYWYFIEQAHLDLFNIDIVKRTGMISLDYWLGGVPGIHYQMDATSHVNRGCSVSELFSSLPFGGINNFNDLEVRILGEEKWQFCIAQNMLFFTFPVFPEWYFSPKYSETVPLISRNSTSSSHLFALFLNK